MTEEIRRNDRGRNITSELFKILENEENQYLTLRELRRWLFGAIAEAHKKDPDFSEFIVAAYQGEEDTEKFVLRAEIIDSGGRKIPNIYFFYEQEGEEKRVSIFEAPIARSLGRINKKQKEFLSLRQICKKLNLNCGGLTFAIFKDYAEEIVEGQQEDLAVIEKPKRKRKIKKKRKAPRRKKTKAEIKARREKELEAYIETLSKIKDDIKWLDDYASKLFEQVKDQNDITIKAFFIKFIFQFLMLKFQ